MCCGIWSTCGPCCTHVNSCLLGPICVLWSVFPLPFHHFMILFCHECDTVQMRCTCFSFLNYWAFYSFTSPALKRGAENGGGSVTRRAAEEREGGAVSFTGFFFMQFGVLVCDDVHAFPELWCDFSGERVWSGVLCDQFFFFVAFSGQGEMLSSYREKLSPLKVSFIFVNQNGFYCFDYNFCCRTFLARCVT